MVYYYLGNALSDQKKLDEAIAQYNEAIERDDTYPRVYNNKGFTLYNQEKLNEAIEQYDEAIKLDPKYSRAYNNKGLALQKNKKLKEAIAAYKKATELNPNDILAKNNLDEAEREQKSAPADRFSFLKRSVVIVEASTIGTGWVVKRESDRALIVTNCHVLRGFSKSCQSELNEKIRVQFYRKNYTDRQSWSNAKIYQITTDQNQLDLAFLEVAGIPNDIQPLPMSSTNVSETQKVTIIGHPRGGVFWSIVSGEISNIDNRQEEIQISAQISRRNSGSPVLNEQDQVVGVLFSIELSDSLDVSTTTKGFGLAYPIKFVKDLLNKGESP